jgi:hypothetical protein
MQAGFYILMPKLPSMTLLVAVWIVSAVVAVVVSPERAVGQREYKPGTPPWVPAIDDCMNAGGSRGDCIEALPPDLYKALTDWERRTGEQRRGWAEMRRQHPVPPPEALPGIYRNPESVPELPFDIAKQLAESGCLVPKPLTGHPNVAIGEFAAKGQQDVAVVCSIDGVSFIRIFWGGPSSCPPLDSAGPDFGFLYKTVEWEYYRAIDTSNPEDILRRYEQYPEECPQRNLPPLEHQALEDIFAEKASSNMYCHAGQWYSLCGAD